MLPRAGGRAHLLIHNIVRAVNCYCYNCSKVLPLNALPSTRQNATPDNRLYSPNFSLWYGYSCCGLKLSLGGEEEEWENREEEGQGDTSSPHFLTKIGGRQPSQPPRLNGFHSRSAIAIATTAATAESIDPLKSGESTSTGAEVKDPSRLS
ncbi:unnamed protein product [Taenia asiatica]|uniref:Casein kinase II subunit beta n=1 Tax=Taenia asiatica TaxID=60517 RepID=A0A0R3W9L1_TAEAS|nr:unnamed protein product [Taenia asiatica]